MLYLICYIICHNIHSLMNFEERVDWLLREVGDQQWDLVVLTETWRAERVEVWRTEHGHTWYFGFSVQHCT